MNSTLLTVLLLACFFTGTIALSCYKCPDSECEQLEEHKCLFNQNYCIEAIAYAHKYIPDSHGNTAIRKKKLQVTKKCADQLEVKIICQQAHNNKGYCESCKDDLCNKVKRKEMMEKMEKLNKKLFG